MQASEAMNAHVAATCQAAAYLDRFLANQAEVTKNEGRRK